MQHSGRKTTKTFTLERPFFIVPVVQCMCPCTAHLLEPTDDGIVDTYVFSVFADLSYILLNL